MGKMIQADSFHGQTMFLNWRGYHGNAYSTYTIYDTGMTTASPYAYSTIIPPFKGCINKVSIVNNPYSSYNTGPTGYEARLYVYKNGTLLISSTEYYASNTPGLVLTFDFGENASFNAGDKIELKFFSNGIWRYYNLGVQLMELA